MEIIVSMVLLTVAVVGFMNLFVTSKRLLVHNRSRMSGGELGRVLLEPLQMSVRQDNWDTGLNSLTAANYYCDDDPAGHPGRILLPGCPAVAGQRTLDGVSYDAEYNITDTVALPGMNNAALRRVVLNLRWQENQP